MHLITGYSGEPHITSANDGEVNAHVFGSGKYVFNSRDKFEADIISNNIVRIHSGEGIINGRYFEIQSDSTEDASIENGTAGVNRIDLIVARYEKDNESNIETMTLTTIKGTPAVNPVAPSYQTGNILDGVGIADFPLYKVTIEALTIKKVEALFTLRSDIVSEVQSDNANTLHQIQEDNSTTLTAIQTSNATTLSAIEESNEETVASVQASNEETLEAIDEKISGVLVIAELWTNPSDTSEAYDITHASINGYKYLEYIYNVVIDIEEGGDEPSVESQISSGLIPVSNGVAKGRVSLIKRKDTIEWGLHLNMFHDNPTTEGTTTIVSNSHGTDMFTTRYLDSDDENTVVVDDYDENETLILKKILGYK